MKFELDNVELYFKNRRILTGIYLKAETGKVTALLGRNGSGKSSLLDIAFGNLKPKYSLVRLDNKPLLKPLYKTGFAKYLPQYNSIPKGFRLSFIFKLYYLSWEEFTSSFIAFSKHEKARLKVLSGGEIRLIETYITLKTKSKIVILDEPYSHLAPLHIESVKRLILEEKKNKIIIISDHMYQHVIDSADDIYLLQNGSTKLIKNLKELETYKYINEGGITK